MAWSRTQLAAAAAALLLAGVGKAQPGLPEGLDGTDSEEEGLSGGPALPKGLSDEKEDGPGPSLPEGLGGPGGDSDGGPALPEGLGGKEEEPPAEQEAQPPEGGLLAGWRLGGYVDTRVGPRLGDRAGQERFALAESRAEIKALRSWSDFTANVTAHFVADAVADQHAPDLRAGEGVIDLREASLLWRPTPFLDIKAGRQILTWGTGDFLFLNDLFPKDYRSFFIGRQDVMLKAPSDAVKASLFSDLANLDVVYTPRFDPDRFLDGDRLSLFNPFTRRIEGDDRTLDVRIPDDVFDDDEWAARLHRRFGRYEAALYAYDGFWKSPNTLLPASPQVTFSRLRAFGASLLGPVPGIGGIGSIEGSYYDSLDDRDGNDPNVPNSQIRLLLGYDKELAPNLTGSVQFFRTHRLDDPARVDDRRDLWTLKLVREWPRRQITLTLFTFYSPTDEDGYFRPRLSWRATDRWTLEAGLNWLFGEDNSTRFGQLEDNTNAFMAARLGF